MLPIRIACALLAALLFVAPAQSRQAKPAAKPHAHKAAPAPAPEALSPGPNGAPGITAAAWVLLDTLSGQTIGAANADERRDPASLT